MRPIAVLLFALLGVLSFQGCSSEDPEKPQNTVQQCPASPEFCPQVGTGTKCCLVNQCGLNFGMGCVAQTSDAGS